MPASGQEPENLEGRPIVEIEFSGLRLLPEDSAAFYLGVAEGTILNWEELNDNIHRLWERRLIDDIDVQAIPQGEGVKLLITMLERPLLTEVEYVGLKRISQSDIEDQIGRFQIRVLEGDSLDLGELYRLGGAIEDIYAEKGYRLALVQYTIREVSPGERKVTFTIDEGDKVKIGEISFDGNTVLSDGKLRKEMEKTKEGGPIASVLKKDVYNAATLEEDLALVGDLYRARGYKNVVLGEGELRIEPVKGEDSKRKLFITVPVQEGARWKLGGLSVEGNETYSDEVLLRQFEQPRGGWLRADVLESGMETVTEIYTNTGYIYSRVNMEIVEREDNVADVVIHVDEGDQYRIGRIEFQGNRRTKDKVIRRELGIQEGYLLNQGALRNSLLRLQQLEFFKVDEDNPVEFSFNDEDKTVDLTLMGDEGERTELQFGAGFSEIDGFFGQFSFTTRNFLGRGETLGLSAQTGRYRDVFDISYQRPWFLDRPQSIGAQLFIREQDYSLLSGQDFFQSTKGGTVTYGRNMGLFGSVSLGYSKYDSIDRRSTFTITGELVNQEFSRDVSTLRLSYGLDRRNSRLNPTAGKRYGASVEYTGGFLGGSSDFYRGSIYGTWYKPTTKAARMQQVFAVNSQAGYILPFNNDEIFFFDRYYSGGESTMRGFRFRSIWVRDPVTNATITDESGFPLGGDKLFIANVEYHFVINESLRFLFWSDAGNVYSEDQDYDITRLRVSAGFEFRVTIPLFGAPLRFIYAKNLDPVNDPQLGADRFEEFQFSISTSF
jgi:outer membrane protein insertion porin family